MQVPVLLRLVSRRGKGVGRWGGKYFSAASPFEGPDQLLKVSNDSPSALSRLNDQNVTSLHHTGVPCSLHAGEADKIL
jgi:hypothetical protein